MDDKEVEGYLRTLDALEEKNSKIEDPPEYLRAEESWEEGEICGKCGSKLSQDGPVWMLKFSGSFRKGLFGSWKPSVSAPTCEDCWNSFEEDKYGRLDGVQIGSDRWVRRPEYRLDASLERFPSAQKCSGCKRRMLDGRRTFSVRYCSNKCKKLVRKLRRRIPTHTNTCQGCEKEFTSKRDDAKFCSNACRQHSYRNRQEKK